MGQESSRSRPSAGNCGEDNREICGGLRTNHGAEALASKPMENLVEDFLQYSRSEKGQAEHTQRTYAALLGKFLNWAAKRGLKDWRAVELKHLTAFLVDEQKRRLAKQPEDSKRKLSTSSI